MKNEPIVSVATVTAGVAAVLGLLVAFGVPLTPDQKASIMAVVAVGAPLVVAAVARRLVTPSSNVVEVRVGDAVVAGAANDRLPEGEPIRTIERHAL